MLLSPTHAGPGKTRLPVLTSPSEPKITSSEIIGTTGRENTEENRRGRALRRTHVTLCVTLAEMLTRTRRQTHIHAHTRTCVSVCQASTAPRVSGRPRCSSAPSLMTWRGCVLLIRLAVLLDDTLLSDTDFPHVLFRSCHPRRAPGPPPSANGQTDRHTAAPAALPVCRCPQNIEMVVCLEQNIMPSLNRL